MKLDKLVMRIYGMVPRFLQNFMITVYGYFLRNKRYGRFRFKQSLNTKISNLDDSKEVENRLREFLKDAVTSVPYYRQKYKHTLPNIDEITLSNFKNFFEILDKNIVRAKAEYFVSESFNIKKLHIINTSGTSGTPLKVYASKKALIQNYSMFNRFLALYGLSELDRSVTFAGRIFIPRKQTNPPYWRKNYAMQTLLMSSYHLGEHSIPFYIKEMERWQPKYIDSYPSAIYEIAHYIVENKSQHSIRPVAIVTSSESLDHRKRHVIETAFECPVYDQYGCAEMAVCAFQLSDGRYFCPPEYSLVEIVDEMGDSVAPGEWGNVVCTGLINDAMPMIRYKIGDTARALDGGWSHMGLFSYLAEIGGRSDDLIVTPDGRRVGRLDPVFKGIRGLVECQIVQTKRDLIEVRVVVSRSYTQETEGALKSALQERIGSGIDLQFKRMDRIPRGINGKFRSVISYL